jgi:hypothetical protein
VSLPASAVAMLSTTCAKYGGVNIATSGAGTGTAKAGSTGAAGHFAMPTGVAAAVAIVGGAVGAML